jgi:hypothetical protein
VVSRNCHVSTNTLDYLVEQFFEMKTLASRQLAILAGSFVFYNAASLINLNVNTVGFYQISKILVTPTVMVLNFMAFGKDTRCDLPQNSARSDDSLWVGVARIHSHFQSSITLDIVGTRRKLWVSCLRG